jgi:2-dehydro-3-deoxy-D-arabinonate dehydratase
MKLGQIELDGGLTAAIFEEGGARPIFGYTMLSLIEAAENQGMELAEFANKFAENTVIAAEPAIPILPLEVWGCGCTYESSAAFRDAEHGTREGFYRHVFMSENRPEVFFKGTTRVCVGPNEAIGLRSDSKFTAPEPELAAILGAEGRILGYTLANDVSAWDIEKENPLYLTQSKVYNACVALGPVIVTADAIEDARKLQMSCRVMRGETERFVGSTSTSRLNRPIELLVEYLIKSNDVPVGTVLLTGTGIIATQEAALGEEDVVSISVPEIGTLANPCAVV